MDRALHHAAFCVGLAAVCWVGAGYVSTNPPALTVTPGTLSGAADGFVNVNVSARDAANAQPATPVDLTITTVQAPRLSVTKEVSIDGGVSYFPISAPVQYTVRTVDAGVVGLKFHDRNDPATRIPSWTKDCYEIQVLTYGKPLEFIHAPNHGRGVVDARHGDTAVLALPHGNTPVGR